MCTVSIKVDDEMMQRISPELTTPSSIGEWLQHQVDELIKERTGCHKTLSPNVHTSAAMKAIVKKRLELMESGEATYIDGEKGFAQIRTHYGL